MSDSTPGSGHPGLGEPTDISAADLDVESDHETPATNDPQAFDDQDLGTGDGPERAGLGGSASQAGGDG